MGCLFFRQGPVENYRDALQCDTKAFAYYYHKMLEAGFYFPPSQFEAFFISTAHSEKDIERTIAANYDSLRQVA